MLREAHRVHVHHSQREDLSVGQSSSSMSERTGRPVGERERERGDLLSQVVTMHRLELCWTDKKSEFLPSARQKLTDTSFKLVMTEEVSENLVKLFNLSEKNDTALELKNFNDEINSFFMDSYCSQIWNYVRLIRKVSMTWKN